MNSELKNGLKSFLSRLSNDAYAGTKFEADGDILLQAIAQCDELYRLKQRLANAEAQEAVGEVRHCDNCGHGGINDSHATDSTCSHCDWHGPTPALDICPSCKCHGTMTSACPKCSHRYVYVADVNFHPAPPATDERVKEDAALWRHLESAGSDETLRFHNTRRDHRRQLVAAALAASKGEKT